MSNSQKYVAELVGTLVVVFVGSAAIITTGADPLTSALAFGLAWTSMWWVFGNVSGGHFNPAITVAALVGKRIDSKDVAPYLVCQVLGGILASALLWFVLRGAPAGLTGGAMASSLANVSLGGWSMVSILVLEALMTAFLALVWLAATEKTHATGITGLSLGIAYAGMLLPVLAVTWSALNPVRTLGPALLANTGFAALGVFWVAPLLGGIVGAAIWTAVVVPGRTASPSSYSTEA